MNGSEKVKSLSKGNSQPNYKKKKKKDAKICRLLREFSRMLPRTCNCTCAAFLINYLLFSFKFYYSLQHSHFFSSIRQRRGLHCPYSPLSPYFFNCLIGYSKKKILCVFLLLIFH